MGVTGALTAVIVGGLSVSAFADVNALRPFVPCAVAQVLNGALERRAQPAKDVPATQAVRPAESITPPGERKEKGTMNETFRGQAQWTTGSRLLKTGETIDFHFFLPPGTAPGDVDIFPQYLKRADPGDRFVCGGDPSWVGALDSDRIALPFTAGEATVTYRPKAPGNYLARWRIGNEVLYRHFAVIDDDWIVVRFSTDPPDPQPSLHATGIPVDYRLPVEQLDAKNALFRTLLGYHRRFGESIILRFPDTPRLTVEERIEDYGAKLEQARTLLPDADCLRSVRVEVRHDNDTGYTKTFEQLGVNDHCGMFEANAKPWLGMPEFPYFASPVDCRKVHQERGGSVVAHQWDFCGGWHFLGPFSWHYRASEGDWDKTESCLRLGLEEAKNLTEMSGHPAFLLPLLDGVPGERGYPNPRWNDGRNDPAVMLEFCERYQRQIAFAFPKEFKLAFARSIDIADYYRRHFQVTARTVFVSKTDHLHYDMWWLCHWAKHRRLVPRQRLPWDTRLSTIMNDRRTALGDFKDPMSQEYIVFEDQRRSIRFERACPNPIWWFDYTVQKSGPDGSTISHTKTPDVDIGPSEVRKDEKWTITLTMRTQAEFKDYAIALWALPQEFDADPSRIETTAREFLLAKNTDGERHLILFFDLKPDAKLTVTLRKGAARARPQ